MRRSAALLTVTAAVVASALAACGSSGSSGTTPPAPQPASVAATASAASSAATSAATSAGAASSQSAVATSLDPCQIVPASEASAVAGASYGAGQEEPSGTDGKRCVYGSETTNVFSVIVGQAATSADADSYWSQEESDEQTALKKQVPAGVKLKEQTQDVSGLADRATVVTGSVSLGGESIAASAIYLLKGTVFLSFSDEVVGGAAPTATALEAEASKALARVP
jgi:trimeric autotransporter adhesin